MQNGLKLIAGSMAGASLIAVTQILTVDCPDNSLTWAVCIFAFSIPLLVSFYLRPPRIEKIRVHEPGFMAAFGYLFLLAFNAAGFAMVFFHFGLIPGFLFVVSFIAANALFLSRDPLRSKE